MSKVLNKAKELSWPKGTDKKKYAYRGGHPTAKFKAAYKKVFPGVSMKKAANCDRAAAVVVRLATGCKMPSGNEAQIKFKPKKMVRKVYKNVRPIDVAKPGDMVVYRKKNGHRHTFIMGEGCIYEAAHEKSYFHRNGSLKKLRVRRPKVVIFREK